MPIKVKNAYRVTVYVAEEDYKFDISGELTEEQMATMTKDVVDPEDKLAGFICRQEWILSDDPECKGCETPQLNELVARSWRIIG
jgi:hypothetical protein